MPSAILFDVDGVLLDSMAAHLQICRDLARDWGFTLTVNDAESVRALARSGIKISPQSAFFRATGFPAADAERAEAFYRAHFADRYTTTLYPGVPQMLHRLHARGVPMGIVSANVLRNITAPFGDLLSLFDPRCILTADEPGFHKRDALLRVLATWQLAPEQAVFIGDQLTDHEASVATGVPFLGTSYGWAIAAEGNPFPVANTVDELELMLQAATDHSPQKA